MIKYLVLSSGAYDFFKELSVLYYLQKKDYLQIDNLHKIYGVSSGSLVGLLLCLNIDYKIIYEYFIERPWHKVFTVDTETVFAAYLNSGIFKYEHCKETFKPLFKKAGIKLNITFKELFSLCGKEFIVYATNCETFEKQTFSYLKTPNAKVLEAVYMSSSLPIIFSPIKFNDVLHIDGGFHDRFPMKSFLQDNSGVNLNEVLGIEIFVSQSKTKVEKTNIGIFLSTLLARLTEKYIYKENNFKNMNILRIRTHNDFSLDKFYDLINKKKIRLKYMEQAKTDVELFLKYIDK